MGKPIKVFQNNSDPLMIFMIYFFYFDLLGTWEFRGGSGRESAAEQLRARGSTADTGLEERWRGQCPHSLSLFGILYRSRWWQLVGHVSGCPKPLGSVGLIDD